MPGKCVNVSQYDLCYVLSVYMKFSFSGFLVFWFIKEPSLIADQLSHSPKKKHPLCLLCSLGCRGRQSRELIKTLKKISLVPFKILDAGLFGQIDIFDTKRS